MKYLKNKNIQNEAKCFKQQFGKEDIETVREHLKAEFGSRLDDNQIEEGITKVIQNGEEYLKSMTDDDSKFLVYDFLRNIYGQLDLVEIQYHFHSLLRMYLQKIREENSTLTEDVFGKLMQVISPYLKLMTVLKYVQESTTPSKSSLKQLLECILCPRVSREDCYKIVFNEIENNNYELINFDLNPLFGKEGYLGEYKDLNIVIKMENAEKKLCFFTKFVPTFIPFFENFILGGSKKESFFYNDLIPYFEKFGLKEITNFIPKCYLTRTNDMIVLEDLSALGFNILSKFVPATYEWVISTIKQLSKLHACSIAVDQKMHQQTGKRTYVGDLFEEYLEETVFIKRDVMDLGMKLISEYFIEKCSYMCKELSVEEFAQKARLEGEKIFEHTKRSQKYYNVISHGDCHSRNVLYNEALRYILIDFQLIRYCPPVIDLLFLIYTSTTRDFRSKYMEDISQIYYDSLKRNLELVNVDVNEFYTHEMFYESFNYYKTTCIIQALCYLQVTLCPNEVLKEHHVDIETTKKFYYEERTKVFDASWAHEPYRARIEGLIEDLYEACKR